MINRYRMTKWWLATTMIAAYALVGTGQLRAQPQPEGQTEMEGVEVQTRGPVHEAFAGVISFHPEPGVVAPKAPPADIEELPPDQKPEGDNVAWIPGYWAWDDDRDDFMWISGIWRALPPGRQWVPGYWAAADQQFQWTSGYWADAGQTEVQYLPEPPASIEQGPNVDAPGDDQTWIPGTWIWNQNRYAWQPGYWAPVQQNWIWVPSCYVWAPGGYIYVNGYWDYSVARRGMLFAPVYFNQNVYSRRGFSYSPYVVINAAVFANQLFLRPNYQHYYFGDYYASNYTSAGFYPWFSFNSRRFGYDPFYAHQTWQNRQNPKWSQSLQANFKNRVDHENARPPRTLVAQQARLKDGAGAKDNDLAIATRIDQIGTNKEQSVKLQKLDKAERQQFAKQGLEVRQFQADRKKLDAEPAGDAKTSSDAPRRTAKLSKSPIAAKAVAEGAADQAPPMAPKAPQADLKVEPKPRDPADRPSNAKRNPKEMKQDPKAVQPKGKPKAEGQPDSKPVPKDEPDSVPTPKNKPKADPTPKPSAPKVDPMPAPKVGPKTEPMPSPKVGPKTEPMPSPKVGPKPKPEPKPKVEPKPEPKAESKPEPKPKVEPRPEPAPKAEPKPAPKPKVEPKPEPAPKAEPKPGKKKSDDASQ